MELFRYFKGLVKSAKLVDSAKRVLGAPWPGKSYRPEGRGNNLLTIATYLRRSGGAGRANRGVLPSIGLSKIAH
jgi:hypothetical protein